MKRGQLRFGMPIATVVVNLVAWVARVRAIQLLPEPDQDALAHLEIAKRLLAQPLRLDLHWVWLPGYHYYLSALFSLGTRPEAIRLLNAGLAVALSALLFGYARARSTRPAVPWLAALFCAVAPIVNLMGISAQQETLFTILVLACAWAVDARRLFAAGLALAAAAMVRYEAWGAVGVLTALGAARRWPALAQRLPRFTRGPKGLLVVAAPALLAIFVWLFIQRLASGKWFGTLHELYRFTKGQRNVLSHGLLLDVCWFPAHIAALSIWSRVAARVPRSQTNVERGLPGASRDRSVPAAELHVERLTRERPLLRRTRTVRVLGRSGRHRATQRAPPSRSHLAIERNDWVPSRTCGVSHSLSEARAL